MSAATRAKQMARWLRAQAALPFGPWEHRPVTPELFASISGRMPGGELAAIRDGYCNNRYAVWYSPLDTDWGPVVHLWIRRHDSEPVRSWADLQRIKNELVPDGRERAAVEVFPPTAELVDQANMYHLWVLPLGFRLPFSLKERAA